MDGTNVSRLPPGVADSSFTQQVIDRSRVGSRVGEPIPAKKPTNARVISK
jgi:hypothetical protein